MSVKLSSEQLDAVDKMKNGCILCGGVGSGKSRTALAYYYVQNGGDRDCLISGSYFKKLKKPLPLYIITTRRKRDTLEWEGEFVPFLLTKENYEIHVDSWNNIAKYATVQGSFFIFDEQRVVGKGKWVKSFLKIAKANKWILLSATPGDEWKDYIPVFIANGFFQNRTEFNNRHVIFSRYTNYPKIERYVNEGMLIKYRRDILIPLEYHKHTVRHEDVIWCDYDKIIYKDIMKNRWNIWENKPIENRAGLCYRLRKIVNGDLSRLEAVQMVLDERKKVIIFYNFDYELDYLVANYYGENVQVRQWNGHKHEQIPDSDSWVYLVQYTAGAEGWNCTTCDTIIFYSQSYSYKTMEQRAGRIDRRNTPFTDLYYYHLKSRRSIDLAITRALNRKENFNEQVFSKKAQ